MERSESHRKPEDSGAKRRFLSFLCIAKRVTGNGVYSNASFCVVCLFFEIYLIIFVNFVIIQSCYKINKQAVRIMMITRESDYGVRIIRALKDGGLMTIGQICERECIPKQFAYKILKKLDLAGLVQIKRGSGGGCSLARDLADMTLYDVIRATDEEFFLTHCLQADFDCEYLAKSPCTIHRELARVQGILEQELRASSMAELLGV